MSSFEKFWRSNFPDVPPVGFSLRVILGHRWIRLHALPESKRYADTDWEYDIILGRANTLADRVLGSGSDCWMVASYPNPDQEFVIDDNEIAAQFRLTESYFWTDPSEALEDQFPWIAYAAECVWRDRVFDSALKRIADYLEPPILWVSKNTKAVFAPYDGGFDIIVPTLDDVDALRDEFADWLSPHPEGL